MPDAREGGAQELVRSAPPAPPGSLEEPPTSDRRDLDLAMSESLREAGLLDPPAPSLASDSALPWVGKAAGRFGGSGVISMCTSREHDSIGAPPLGFRSGTAR